MIKNSRWVRSAVTALVAGAIFTLEPGVAMAQEDGFASLLAAEHAFAADAMRDGITPAFRAHAAQDSVLLAPGPVSAAEHLAKQQDTPGLTLEWQPRMAGVARSGDLGFTSGPYRLAHGGRVSTGEFLTIWSRGADGRWRWFLDHGLPPQAATGAPLTSPASVQRFAFVALSEKNSAPDRGLEAAEQALNLGYLDKGVAALLPALSRDGYLLRPGRSPLAKSDVGAFTVDPRRFAKAERLGSRTSADGDLAASYGRLLPASGAPAYYVRIWRRSDSGWELLIDELV